MIGVVIVLVLMAIEFAWMIVDQARTNISYQDNRLEQLRREKSRHGRNG